MDLTGTEHDIFSVDESVGAADTITGGADNDILLGGAGGDAVSGDAGNDIVFGDSGRVDRDNTDAIEQVSSTALGVGAGDVLYGNAGRDIVVGGAAGDEIYGGDGSAANALDLGAVLLGDSAPDRHSLGSP